MATKKSEEVTSSQVKATEKSVAVKYPASEIISAYKAFNAPKFLVATAINMSGKDFLTEEEAAKIIKNFMNKEV